MVNGYPGFQDALADRFDFEREIGSGATATVFLARDIKHQRRVAIKVLWPEFAATLTAERFLREIEIASQLQHPHILPLLDSGEAAGSLYFIMPYVEGETLRQRLHRDGRLSIPDTTRILADVADALAYAHQNGVVHRDIKPDNVMLAGRNAMVMDFGVAKAASAAQTDRPLTGGMAIGTPAYMAPEQALADPASDHRVDIYAFGVLGYELLTGEPPFVRPTPQDVLAAHVSHTPELVTELRPEVPAKLGEVVMRSLEKLPDERWESVSQIVAQMDPLTTPGAGLAATSIAPGAQQTSTSWRTAAMTRPARVGLGVAVALIIAIVGAVSFFSQTDEPVVSTGVLQTPRLAVLPFTKLDSTEDDYFADGITEEIASRIVEVSGIAVISRTSAMQYKNHNKTLQQIGDELSVQYVLDGTIRTDRSGGGPGRVRVTPQLVRVSDDAQLWTDRYTANIVPGEIFSVQEQIADEVARALSVTLVGSAPRHMAARRTDNPEAYDFFLRANDYARRGAGERNVQIAIDMYSRAVNMDPTFALGYAFLSRTHSRAWWYYYDRSPERLEMAKEAVDAALELNPDLPEAHEAMGWYHYWGHLDYDRALAEFAIARRVQPNNTDLLSGIAAVLRRQGKMEDALATYLHITELDPMSAAMATNLADTYFLLRQPVDAARYLNRAISLSPDWPVPYAEKARFVHLRLEGDIEEAKMTLIAADQVGLGVSPEIAYTWIWVHILEGDYEAALDRLDAYTSDVLLESQLRYVLKSQRYAQVHGLMGNRQREQAYYDSTRVVLEARVRRDPEDARFRSALGLTYAGLGRKQDAILEGERAVNLLPMSTDAWAGGQRLEDLARIYTATGEHDAAVAQLETLLAVPSITAVPILRIDPVWIPLADHPRFRTLLAN